MNLVSRLFDAKFFVKIVIIGNVIDVFSIMVSFHQLHVLQISKILIP